MNTRDLWCTSNGGFAVDDVETNRLISVVPSERQKRYMTLRYYSFIHFTVNTFTSREWGDGTESEEIFNPTELDTDQWCRVLKESGSRGIILTAKHHDGFCLFDTKYTDHNSMNSPVHCDVVAMLAESCRRYDMKLGIYLSPWDRHEKTYGTPQYNDFFVGQLTELCTKYGEIFEFWFDGACGEGVDGATQFYDWERYWNTIRKYQPNAIIANCGPDVRWIGNEAGKSRPREFNVLSWDGDTLDNVQGKSQRNETDIGHLQSFDRMDEDIGSRDKVRDKANLVWYPAEADVSVDNGWFYHDDEYYTERNLPPTRTPEQLADIAETTIGSGASLLLNVPPNKKGLLDKREIDVLTKARKILDDRFAESVGYKVFSKSLSGQIQEVNLPYEFEKDVGTIHIKADKPVSRMFLSEDTDFSQRIEQFTVNGEIFYTVGTGKIIHLSESVSEITLDINIARGVPHIKEILLFK